MDQNTPPPESNPENTNQTPEKKVEPQPETPPTDPTGANPEKKVEPQPETPPNDAAGTVIDAVPTTTESTEDAVVVDPKPAGSTRKPRGGRPPKVQSNVPVDPPSATKVPIIKATLEGQNRICVHELMAKYRAATGKRITSGRIIRWGFDAAKAAKKLDDFLGFDDAA
jgi:hypothetical protein